LHNGKHSGRVRNARRFVVEGLKGRDKMRRIRSRLTHNIKAHLKVIGGEG